MSAVLLIPADADEQTSRCACALARAGGGTIGHIGRGGGWAGVLGAALALRRGEAPGLVHAWGQEAFMAAVFGTGAPVVYSPSADISPGGVRWLRAAMAYRDVQVACSTSAMHRRLLVRGIPAGRCSVVRPGVDLAARPRRDGQLRRALGISDDQYILLAAGRSTRGARHELAAWTAAILHGIDPRYRLLVAGTGQRAARVAAFATALRGPGMLCVAGGQLAEGVAYEQLHGAADMVLWTGDDTAGMWALGAAMAAGLPIVAAVSASASEWVEDRHTAMFAAASPRLLARRILELRADPGLQQRLTSTARAECYEYFAMSKVMEQWRGLYAKVNPGQRS